MKLSYKLNNYNHEIIIKSIEKMADALAELLIVKAENIKINS
jgi:hypothetical protein